jgi:hypothetical protein
MTRSPDSTTASLRTRSGLPKHCSFATDRHGKRRVRFRRGAVSAYLTGIPWSEDFMRQYAAALAGAHGATNIGAERIIPGSFDALCVSYYACEFRALEPSTQIVRRNIIENIRDVAGKNQAAACDRAYIERVMEARKDTPAAANNYLKVFRLLFAHGVRIGMVKNNPTLGVKRYKITSDGIATWSEDDIGVFEAAYALGSKERLTLALALYTGQRIGDITRMGWQHATATTSKCASTRPARRCSFRCIRNSNARSPQCRAPISLSCSAIAGPRSPPRGYQTGSPSAPAPSASCGAALMACAKPPAVVSPRPDVACSRSPPSAGIEASTRSRATPARPIRRGSLAKLSKRRCGPKREQSFPNLEPGWEKTAEKSF